MADRSIVFRCQACRLSFGVPCSSRGAERKRDEESVKEHARIAFSRSGCNHEPEIADAEEPPRG